jgi:hypothetical protein
MATTEKTLSNLVWTKVSAAGESGSCWKNTGGTVVIDHTDQETAATLPLSNVNVAKAKSKRIPLNKDDGDVLLLPADNVSDIFYALSLSGLTDRIVVDMV